MQLSIINCPDRKNFAPYVKKAVKYYASELFTKKMFENLYVQIVFKDSEDYGYAAVTEYSLSGKPRGFEIQINPYTGAKEILATIAHEMVHVKQYVYEETNETLTRWKGSRVDSDKIDYWKYPWEIEAHGLEVSLFTRFAIKEKLWDVFEGVKNPDEPIEKKNIEWKHRKDCNVT